MCESGGMVDTPDLGSGAARCESSNLSSRTNFKGYSHGIDKRERWMLWIDAPHYCAGATFNVMKVCVRAAPIIKWMKGKQMSFILNYIRKKGFTYEISDVIEEKDLF